MIFSVAFQKVAVCVNIYTDEVVPCYTPLRLSLSNVSGRYFRINSRGFIAFFTCPFPILDFQGQELTILQILSFVRSYSPDFVYQNALASVGFQVFGEHVSRTLGD